MRPLKFILGLALLPLAWVVVSATARLIAGLQPDTLGAHPYSAAWLGGGFLLWLFLFVTMPRPMRTYVLGHELTHAFWALLMGARVSKLRVSAHGGSVTVSKTNWIITLAPYFFPFYSALLLVVVLALGFFWDLRPYEPLVLALLGLTYAFHVTFTISMLTLRQPDIQEHGRLFSYAVIVLLNTLVLGGWIVAAAPPTARDYARLLEADGRRTAQHLQHVGREAIDWLRAQSK